MNETKKEILEKSLILFMQKSYKEVTMRDIINAVGLSKGGFYHHFQSKEDVYEQCVNHFYNDMLISDYNSFPRTSLKDFYNHYVEQIGTENMVREEVNTPSRFIFILESSQRIPSFMQIHENQRQKELEEWTEIVGLAQKKKEINSRLTNSEIAKMFLNLSDGVVLNNMFNSEMQTNVRN